MIIPEEDTRVATITKTELSRLPAEHFEGEICLVDSKDDVAKAVADLRADNIIGFDTETRPSFKRGQSHTVALMQLSTHRKCYLFRLNHIGLPDAVKDLLEDENVLKIGLSIHDDFHNLAKISDVKPAGFIDLQSYVKQFKILDNSLTRIYGIIFNKRISKGQRLTNWEADNLTPGQQAYAALDALACIHVYDYLNSGKFHAEDSIYFREPPQPPLNPNQIKAADSEGKDADGNNPSDSNAKTAAPAAENAPAPAKKRKKKKKKKASSSNPPADSSNQADDASGQTAAPENQSDNSSSQNSNSSNQAESK